MFEKNWADFQKFLEEVGATIRFSLRIFRYGPGKKFEWAEFFRQCYYIGYLSLPLIGITGFIMGLVLTIQLRPKMVEYGVEAQIPAMVGIALIRELGPVITALIFAGKIGSSIGAELGSMKVTEQIDAMEVSGTNPYRYLVVTRVLACTLMLPLLVILSDVIALYGTYLGVNIKDITSLSLFIKQVFDSLDYYDFIPAFIKTFFFGFAVGIIGCYKGYTTLKGTEGVGLSANAAVVISSLLVFIIDLVVVQVTDLLFY